MFSEEKTVMDGQSGGPKLNRWKDKLQFSEENIAEDIRLLKKYFNAEKVVKTDIELDIQGIDYLIYLKNGEIKTADVKRREYDADKYWGDEPELALELYSDVEQEKLGWTTTPKDVDYIVFIFKTRRFNEMYVFEFYDLYRTFEHNGRHWAEELGIKMQQNDNWWSSAIFVPVLRVRNIVHHPYLKATI